jgi:hypothetical protein
MRLQLGPRYHNPLYQAFQKAVQEEHTGNDFTLPGYNYLGPGTKIVHNLLNDVKPVDMLDEFAYQHDWEYFNANDTLDIQLADRKFRDRIWFNAPSGQDPPTILANLAMQAKPNFLNSSFLNGLTPQEKQLVNRYRLGQMSPDEISIITSAVSALDIDH